MTTTVIAAIPSASPNWAETTVRTLRSYHPGLTPGASVRSFNTLLFEALVRAKYLYAEMVEGSAFNEKKWKASIEQASGEWTRPHHDRFLKFLKNGGYSVATVTVATAKLKKSAPKISGIKADFIIPDELDAVEAAVVAATGKPSQLSPKHELEEILETAALKDDPRYGGW